MKNYQVIDLRDRDIPSVKFCILNKGTGQLAIFYGMAGFKDWNHLIDMVKYEWKYGSHTDVVEALDRVKPEWL